MAGPFLKFGQGRWLSFDHLVRFERIDVDKREAPSRLPIYAFGDVPEPLCHRGPSAYFHLDNDRLTGPSCDHVRSVASKEFRETGTARYHVNVIAAPTVVVSHPLNGLRF